MSEEFSGWQGRLYMDLLSSLSTSHGDLKGLKEAVNSKDEIIKMSNNWLEKNLPPVYGAGWLFAAKALGLNPGPKAIFSVPHQQAISIMINNDESKFGEAIQTIGRRVDDIYRTVSLGAARDRLAGGAVPTGVGEAEAKIVKDLKENGITAFTDSAGRKWELETYANMAMRTIQMEAYMQGSINKYVDEGVDYVEVGGAEPVPGVSSEAAFEYFGKILCLSGEDSRFDSLAMAEEAGLMHPNNWRDLLPLTKEEVDGAAEAQGLESKPVSNDYPTTSLGSKDMFKEIGGSNKGKQAEFTKFFDDARGKVIEFGNREKDVVLAGMPKNEDGVYKSTLMKEFVVGGVSEQFAMLRPDSLTDEQIQGVYQALADNDDFSGQDGHQYAVQYNKEDDADVMNITNMLTHEWANTSDSGDTIAVALQERAEELFGIKADYKHWADGKEFPNLADRVDKFMQTPGMQDTLDTFLKSQYMQTQMMFEEKGITEVTLFRGFAIPNETRREIFGTGIDSGQANILLQPMSSFSTRLNTAEGFASAHPGETAVVIGARVPVDRILGTFSTGYGCLSESEMVVLGAQTDPDKVFFALGRSGTSNSGRQAGDTMADLLINNAYKIEVP